ncbi:hypothetical protein C2S51_020683 [Perilla frutescens var. frutescens]|nr:hypothetical protein C2S51_020683 [Perilla frutescens var. frutescens]
MPKQNRRIPWNKVVLEERGFHIENDADEDQAEGSRRSVNVAATEGMIERFNIHGDQHKEITSYRVQSNDALHGKNRANYVDDEDMMSGKDEEQSQMGDHTADMTKRIQEEVNKYLGNYFKTTNAGQGMMSSAAANMVDAGELNPSDTTMSHYAFGLLEDEQRNEWIVDSGASIHMCCNAALMQTMKKLTEPHKFFLPDGSNLWAHYCGEVKLNDDILLKNVLFAPSFTHNLISVGQMAKDLKGKVIFLPSHCLIQNEENDHILGIGKLKGKLYVFKHVTADLTCSVQSRRNLSLQQWHTILGHPSVGTMRHIPHLKRAYAETANRKGYILYNLDHAKVLISRDVHFCPDIYPLQSLESTPVLPFPSFDDTPSPDSLVFTPSANKRCPPIPSTSSLQANEPALRRSTRLREPPAYLRDYVCTTSFSSLPSKTTTAEEVDDISGACSNLGRPSKRARIEHADR